MRKAVEVGEAARGTTSPNPWVGAVVVGVDGSVISTGATSPPGGPHAEVLALRAAGAGAAGATLYSTLEPCSHHGRTPPCVDAIVKAGVAKVVVGVVDPDEQVSGRGVAKLLAAGLDVRVGIASQAVEFSLAAYLKHRRPGRPWVVVKLAATLDGRIAAPDGTSKWITGREARADAHRLRALSDAVAVGAATVRADDPALTVRDAAGRDPLRVVIGSPGAVDPGAKVHPALFHEGDLGDLLDDLGGRGVLQLLVEGGARVAGEFHRLGLVDQYTLYFAPALMGGDDGLAMFAGPGATTMSAVSRGRIASVRSLGADLRVDLVAGADDDLR
jgi:diaminohydroxyphosphoribosylaminopyrimidine deaminase/5-amino-6-(5-phosphoribosylamino)uracil reductase